MLIVCADLSKNTFGALENWAINPSLSISVLNWDKYIIHVYINMEIKTNRWTDQQLPTVATPLTHLTSLQPVCMYWHYSQRWLNLINTMISIKSAMIVVAQNPNQQQHVEVARSGTNCADYITLIRMHTEKQ